MKTKHTRPKLPYDKYQKLMNALYTKTNKPFNTVLAKLRINTHPLIELHVVSISNGVPKYPKLFMHYDGADNPDVTLERPPYQTPFGQYTYTYIDTVLDGEKNQIIIDVTPNYEPVPSIVTLHTLDTIANDLLTGVLFLNDEGIINTNHFIENGIIHDLTTTEKRTICSMITNIFETDIKPSSAYANSTISKFFKVSNFKNASDSFIDHHVDTNTPNEFKDSFLSFADDISKTLTAYFDNL